MSTPTFTVNSGIGRFQFGRTKCPTPVHAESSHREAPNSRSSQEIVKVQNQQLSQLKEQYIRLRAQLQQEEKESSLKILKLQRQLRAEQKQVEQNEQEIAELTKIGPESVDMGSSAVVEQIWQLMQSYRQAIESDVQVVKREDSTASSSLYDSKRAMDLSIIEEDSMEMSFGEVKPMTPMRHDLRRGKR